MKSLFEIVEIFNAAAAYAARKGTFNHEMLEVYRNALCDYIAYYQDYIATEFCENDNEDGKVLKRILDTFFDITEAEEISNE